MSNGIQIRRAVESDSTLLIAFNAAMALETENKVLDPLKVSQGVRSLFTHPEYGFYLVAEVGDCVVASLMITTEWSDWRNGVFWWVQSVYVTPEHRRHGIYRKLYHQVQALAKNDPSICGMRLYVEKDNLAAQQAYLSLGMKETNYKMFEEHL